MEEWTITPAKGCAIQAVYPPDLYQENTIMNKSYDLHGAESLIPLLRVIQNEIGERQYAIRSLARRVQETSETKGPSQQAARTKKASLNAEISAHRLEIRLAQKELKTLGCECDSIDPRTVHIPGENGTHESGFTWRVGQADIHTLQTE